MSERIAAVWLGQRRYGPVHELQRVLNEARRAGHGKDVVLFLEHEPVITLGRGSHAEHVLAPRAALAAAGIDLETVGRGGDVTLHAPGQLVCYPILELAPGRRDVRRYVNDLTEVMRRTVADAGFASGPVAGMVGLWVDADDPTAFAGAPTRLAKVGAIGVRMSRWVTMHGFALNVAVDLDLYRYIVPCGISSHPVTSLAALGAAAEPVYSVADRARRHFADVFGAELTPLVDRSSAPLDPGILSLP